jgi:hypothetical protein
LRRPAPENSRRIFDCGARQQRLKTLNPFSIQAGYLNEYGKYRREWSNMRPN